MLVGDVTRRKASDPNTFVYYESHNILRLGLPVVFANVNRSREAQVHRIPQMLLEPYTMSTSFGPTILRFVLDNFPKAYQANLALQIGKRKTGPFHYLKPVYDRLGL